MACDGDAVLVADFSNTRIARVAPAPHSAAGDDAPCDVTTFAQLGEGLGDQVTFNPYSVALRVPAATG
eukprot:gene1376-54176_t